MNLKEANKLLNSKYTASRARVSINGIRQLTKKQKVARLERLAKNQEKKR